MKIGAIGIRTKIIVGDAATWYLVKKYVDGKVAQPRHIVVDEYGNEMQDLPKLKFVGADVENVDGATVVTFTKEQPEFIQIINKINLSWVDGFVYINTGSVLNPWSGTTSKKVIVHSLSINTGQGTTILNPIVNYPSAATYQVSSIPTGFYIKDTDNLLQINNDFEHLEIQYSIVDDTVRKYDSTKFNYGSNVIIDDSSLPHADAMYAIFYDIYPAFDKSLIKTCTDTLANNITIDPFFTPTFCKERDSNLIFRPQLDAARYKETGSNADILTVGSHYNNVFARVDITENSTTFLKNVIAIGSCPDVELPTIGTSYGYGLEFFEDNVKTSDVYPDYVYNVWSPIYQQSATSAIIAAKFRMIKDATKASWGLCRIAARATAKKTVGGIYDSGYAWDMYRGFGIIDVNDAIDYIEEIYKSDEYIQMLADQHEGLNKVNEFITYDKLLANSPVPKRHLDAALDLKVDKLANHSLVADTEIDKLAEYPEFEDLEFSHESLTDKNSEAAVQHVDTTVTKEDLDEADKVALFDSVTGKVVLSNALNDIETILESI